MFNLKYCLILSIGICLNQYAGAQLKKSTAPLDEFEREVEVGAFIYHEIGTGESFDDENVFESAPGSAEHIIPEINLPRIRNQHSIPLCQIFCPTVLVEYKYCKQRGIENCRDLPDSQRLSPIGTLVYRDSIDNPIKATIGSLSSGGKSKPYEIMNSISVGSPQFFITEGCAPFDKIVEKFNNDAKSLEQFRLNLQSKFVKIRAKLNGAKANVENCPDCIALMNAMNEGFHSKIDFPAFEEALEATEFDNFLYEYLFSRRANSNNETCNLIRLKKKIRADYFPTEPNVSLARVFETITEQLKKHNPVILSSVCFTKSKVDGVCTAHCLVLTGERQVRNRRTGEIVKLIRVHNSWGKKWQDNHSDGWVRLERLKSIVRTADDSLLKESPEHRKNSFGHTVSWFDQD